MDVTWKGRGAPIPSVVTMNDAPRHRRSPRRPRARVTVLLTVLAAAAGAALLTTGASSAAFTSQSGSLGSVRAASDWTAPTVSMTSPGAAVRSTVPLTVSASDADSGVKEVVIQQRPVGGSSWTTACTSASSPFGCSWATGALTSGSYELRATATDRAGNTTTSAIVRTLVDNTAPAVAMSDPGTPLSGTRTVAATANDAHSGIASVAVQAQASGATSWTTLCTVTSAPFSCSIDTRTLTTDTATYAFRAVATDVAGNTSTSTPVANRVVDNVVSTVTLADPGAYLTGTVTLEATASSTAGIRSVTIQRAPAGSSTWTDVCSTTSSPHQCPWNTSQVSDGSYDLRAVLTDSKGRTTTSAVVAARRVHNATLAGADVQTINGGTPGRPDAGDQIVYTFNRQVNLGSIRTGWNGGPTDVPVVIGRGLLGTSDLDVTGTNLGTIDLAAAYTTILSFTARFDATMTATTETVDGVPRTVVVVQLERHTSGSLATVNGTPTMRWTPTSSLRDLLGRAASTATVTESGTADRDF